jgi:hypothetical protein
MKNKLAENMLRFGVKNLTESNIKKLTENQGPIRMTVAGRRNKESLGSLKLASKIQIPYDTRSVTDPDSRAISTLSPKDKYVNANYTLSIYNRVLLTEFPMLTGGTVILDKLEFVAPGGAGTSLDWNESIELNQQIPLSKGSLTTTQFQIPIPGPNVKANFDSKTNKVNLSWEESARGLTTGIDGGRYTLRGRIQSRTIDRDTYEANVKRAIANGKIKDTDDGVARMKKWDAANPTGTSAAGTSGEFFVNIPVSLSNIAIPVSPSQGRG